ncbi:bifunctional ADP-dependent NAD(P)H-hydrate dehydratase/NAD(P)H-hydrate epimerase [Prevotella sp. P5-92]|uniref:NAD(P)H-hydrate dehydratase n=1 Tax=Prevotella sp. P5-92 TaxID=2024222 RepID=UPI000B97A001|nr:NAD(P)H-hydrate dehydratase [Prevotella sp. P5-92]OYP57953.1 bifunctional ADP-dependent NAD(P)H-hydrate dehydratase/NAD(P)H-hydrate epimerase [Prevotella sp. P5-92]
MKIFSSTQIHELDKYTIDHEPIKSIDLMERAASRIVAEIRHLCTAYNTIVVFAGPGNNGGDALAVARILASEGLKVKAWLFNTTGRLSADCKTNRDRLTGMKELDSFTMVIDEFDPPTLDASTLVIDGLFGVGLNKPLTGGYASLVKYINASPSKVVSIDMPSGLMSESNEYNVRSNIIRADVTVTIQQPKLSFLFAENQQFIGELKVVDINISKEGMAQVDAHVTILEEDDVRCRIRQRDDFAHKGTMGHALIIAGSRGMAGAAMLATKACLRSGVGKVTVHTPAANIIPLQIGVPEAILDIDPDNCFFTEAVSTDRFQAMGIGPGLGNNENSAITMIGQLRRAQCPIVIDADAINILATHKAWMQQLPAGCILTPHIGEFERLEGASSDSYDRLSKAIILADRQQAYIVLKGHNTAIVTPGGRIMFCPTGNSGMATAGSGDVLTGVITALLARGYAQADACLVGTYLHGLAGDIAAKKFGKESLMASDIIDALPEAFMRVMS